MLLPDSDSGRYGSGINHLQPRMNALSSDRDQSFQAMVITVSKGS
jgi:hypothetical protein